MMELINSIKVEISGLFTEKGDPKKNMRTLIDEMISK
jgi:hypothetical protein